MNVPVRAIMQQTAGRKLATLGKPQGDRLPRITDHGIMVIIIPITQIARAEMADGEKIKIMVVGEVIGVVGRTTGTRDRLIIDGQKLARMKKAPSWRCSNKTCAP